MNLGNLDLNINLDSCNQRFHKESHAYWKKIPNQSSVSNAV